MKKTNLEKGKSIFFECFGSSFYIDRDYGKDYYDCNISPMLECQWREEIKQSLFKDLQSNEVRTKMSAINRLLQLLDLKSRIDLLFDSLNQQWDTFSKIILCETLSKEKSFCKDIYLADKIKEVLQINKDLLLKEPITIDKSYLEAISLKDYNFTNESIKNRINKL